MNQLITDAAESAAFNFAVNQSATINATVYKMKFPDLDYGRLVFVDSSAGEWSTSIVSYSSSSVGRAEWVDGMAKDVPLAEVTLGRSESRVHMAAIGYTFNEEEIGMALASRVPINLQPMKAQAARTSYEEFMYRVAISGDTDKGLGGLTNQSVVVAALPPADGTGGVTTWFDNTGTLTKTAAQIVRDVNAVLTGQYLATFGVETCDTLLLPLATLTALASTPYSALQQETLLGYIQRTNLYTLKTGQPLTIREAFGLETLGAGGTKRMVAYRNSPDIVKLHLPMPLQFQPLWRRAPWIYDVPGRFRTGGVEVMRPQAFRYLDGI